MRKELGKIEGTRTKFTATISKFGKKNNYRGLPSDTVLFTDVKNEKEEIIADHIWFVIGKTLSCVMDNLGKQVSFDARVKSYVKGYKGYREDVYRETKADYRLSNPTNITILKNEEMIKKD
jgi:hypothetical protein